MQNTPYGGYPATAGYYSQPTGQPPPPPQSAPGTAPAAIPAYGGTANPYGSSYQQPPATASDQYSTYTATTTQPIYDAKSQTQQQQQQPQPPQQQPPQGYMGYGQGPANAVPPPPTTAAPNAVANYGVAATGSEAYGANPYGYQGQAPAPPSNVNAAQPPGAPPPPPPAGYSAPYGNTAPNAAQWSATGGPQQGPPPPPPPQSNYGAGPNGYSGYNANGMNRNMQSGPSAPPMGPSNYSVDRSGPMSGRNAGGPGAFKAGPSGGGGGYMPLPADMENDTIFISGMPLDITEDQLASHFGSIGIIKMDRSQKQKIWIYRDKVTGEGKGEATLTYEDPHTAKSAIQWFHNKELPGTGKILNVEFAQRKTPAGGDFKGGRNARSGSGGGPMRSGRDGGGRDGGGGRGGTRNRDNGFVRQGDWRCPSCNNNNFSWREHCNRCKAPRPEDVGGGSGGGNGDHRRPPMDRRGGPPRRDGPPMRSSHGGDRGGPMRGGRMGGGSRGGGRGDFGSMRGPPIGDRRSKPY